MEFKGLAMWITIFMCAFVGTSFAMVMPQRETEPGMRCGQIAPGLMGAFGFHCVMPTGDATTGEPMPDTKWIFDGEAISNSVKYFTGMRHYRSYYEGKRMMVYDTHLIINNIGANDIGAYSLHVDMPGKTMEQTLMVTDALACGDHPMCIENNCEWPFKLRCNSNPDAYCQMDMCNQSNLCMPRWFVGEKPVICEEVEEVPQIE